MWNCGTGVQVGSCTAQMLGISAGTCGSGRGVEEVWGRCEGRKLWDREGAAVQSTEAHLLVQVLGQHVDLPLVAAGVALVPEFQLGYHLQEWGRGGGGRAPAGLSPAGVGEGRGGGVLQLGYHLQEWGRGGRGYSSNREGVLSPPSIKHICGLPPGS